MKCIVAFVYLLICSTSLLSGGPLPFLFEQQFDPQRKVGDASAVADKKWLSTQADTLLAIIKVLFKGDEATVIRYIAPSAIRALYFLWAVVILVGLNPCQITRADPIQIQPQRSEGGGGTETKCIVKLRVVDGNRMR